MCNHKKSIIELVRLLGNMAWYDVERNYLEGKITGVKNCSPKTLKETFLPSAWMSISCSICDGHYYDFLHAHSQYEKQPSENCNKHENTEDHQRQGSIVQCIHWHVSNHLYNCCRPYHLRNKSPLPLENGNKRIEIAVVGSSNNPGGRFQINILFFLQKV